MGGIGFWLTKRELLLGDREAVVDAMRRLSYRALNRRINRLARSLQSMGLKQGDRIAVLAYNGLEYVETIFAAAKLGLILVPLNWRLAPAELAFIVSDSTTETLLFDFEFAKTVETLRGQTPLRRFVAFGGKEVPGAEYYNGAPGQTILIPETTTSLATAGALDEGGNFIDVRFGPLTLYTVTDPATGAQGPAYGDYHLQDASQAKCLGATGVGVSTDWDGQTRPITTACANPNLANTRPDAGADER